MTVGWLSPHSVTDYTRLPLRGGANDGGVARSPDLPKAERKLFTVPLFAACGAVGNFTQPIMN